MKWEKHYPVSLSVGKCYMCSVQSLTRIEHMTFWLIALTPYLYTNTFITKQIVPIFSRFNFYCYFKYLLSFNVNTNNRLLQVIVSILHSYWNQTLILYWILKYEIFRKMWIPSSYMYSATQTTFVNLQAS